MLSVEVERVWLWLQRRSANLRSTLLTVLRASAIAKSRQLIEQRLGLFQMNRVEAFGEQAVALAVNALP